jgi:DNA replication protein DnaC
MESIGQILKKAPLPFPISRRNSSRESGEDEAEAKIRPRAFGGRLIRDGIADAYPGAGNRVHGGSRIVDGEDEANPNGHALDETHDPDDKSEADHTGDDRPEAVCPVCGAPMTFVFMDNLSYLKITGKEPFWAELPCGTCERKRVIRELEERSDEASRNRLNSLIANSMLRERFLDKTFANFIPFGKDKEKQLYVLSIARDFADDFNRHRRIGTWLLFMGNVGAGKSHLCAAVINQLVRAGRTALFTKAPRLLREVKETFNRDSEVTQSEIIARMGELDLLVIDEVGIQFGTDTERMILYEILDLRYESMRPVILTTNITDLKSLEKLLGPRIIDRLFEGESKIVFFDWASHRRFSRSAPEPGPPLKPPGAITSMGGKSR